MVSDSPHAPGLGVLITGGTGYVGSRLAQACSARGDQTHILTRSPTLTGPRQHRYDGSMSSVQAAFSDAGPGVVFHLAAVAKASHSSADVDSMIQAGITLATQLCEACAGTGATLILAGSYWQYGPDGSPKPNSLYAACKQAARDVASWYARARSLRVCELVLFDVYGPDDPRPKLLPALIARLGSAQELPLTPGDQPLDLVHVDDVIRAFLHAAVAPGVFTPGRAAHYAVRGGQPRTLKQIVSELEEVAGRKVPCRWGGVPYPPHQIFELPLSIPPLPGFTPSIDLHTGLRGMLSAFSAGYAGDLPVPPRA